MSAYLTKSEWDHWCNEFGESHQTKIGFCRDNNPSNHRFLYWFEKYNKTSDNLIPVKIADPKQPLVRLRLGNGCSIVGVTPCHKKFPIITNQLKMKYQ